MNILFCDTTFEHAREALRRHLPDDEILHCPEAAIGDRISDVDVAIRLMAMLDAPRLEKGQKLRLIHQFGVGLDGVDIAAAQRRGIAVARVPSRDTGNAIAVAEWTLFLMLALALDDATRGLIGKEELERMQRSAYLINVSRGPLVDYDGLLWALREGRIAGAGLDVYWREPVDPADPILEQNVVASPHVAGVTDYSYDLMAGAVAENVERLRRGLPLENVV